jgi:hypothetical protein
MADQGEVTIERNGKQFGATYSVDGGMLHLKTHTETRSLELGNEDPRMLAQRVLKEIVAAQPNP